MEVAGGAEAVVGWAARLMAPAEVKAAGRPVAARRARRSGDAENQPTVDGRLASAFGRLFGS